MAELQVGQEAPDFETFNDNGDKVKLSDFRGKRVVLYFYPKDDTAGCTTQACSFRDVYPDIEAKNAVVLGVSPDGVDSHVLFRDKNSLPFPLLVDEDKSIADSYGVWIERERDGNKFMGINRSHFVIDESGKISDVQYGVRPADSAVLSMEKLG